VKSRIVGILVVFVAFLFVGGQALARDKGDKPGKPKGTRVVGTVAVTKEKVKDDKGVETEVVKSITITSTKKTETTVYNVVLDDTGKKLAEMDGKKVTAKGTVEEKDGNKLLTVTSYEEFIPKPKAPKGN